MRLNIHGLIDNAKCHQMVRQLRWAEGVECPHCHAAEVVKNGTDETHATDNAISVASAIGLLMT